GDWKVDSTGGTITTIAVSPNNEELAIGFQDGIVTLYKLNRMTLQKQWDQLDNSSQLFSDFAVFKSLQPRGEAIQSMPTEINCLGFSADGERLLIASSDGTNDSKLIRAWHISTKTALFTLSGDKTFTQVEFAADGSHIISLNNNGEVHIWTDPIGSLKNGHIYRLSDAERKTYGIEVEDY
nr:hypothetical protein [Saprospiraceae bacterium]